MGVREPLEPGMIPGLCERLDAILDERNVGLVLCAVVGPRKATAVTVEALARLRIVARRRRRRLRVVHPWPELRGLVALMGLEELLLLQPEGEPEEREQPRGVEEEGEAADPPS
ncbi:MAG TPA: hypothetical protein VF058_02325 [Actinomycetota bacterium]